MRADRFGNLVVSAAGSRGRRLTAQEAFAAINRSALCRLEGHRSFPTALRAHGHGLGLGKSPATGALAFRLARLTALGLVLKILVVEEVLFSRCEHEIRSAVYTLKDAVLKLRHSNCAP